MKKIRIISRGNDLSHDDIRALGDVFRTYPAIQGVYVFGSSGTEDIVLKYEAMRQNRLIYATQDF